MYLKIAGRPCGWCGVREKVIEDGYREKASTEHIGSTGHCRDLDCTASWELLQVLRNRHVLTRYFISKFIHKSTNMDITESLYPKPHQKWETLQSRGGLIQRKKI